MAVLNLDGPSWSCTPPTEAASKRWIRGCMIRRSLNARCNHKSQCDQQFLSLRNPSDLKIGGKSIFESISSAFGNVTGRFFEGSLSQKFLKLLGYLALSRLGIYVPLGGVEREAFAGNLEQNSLLSTLDSLCGGGVSRLGVCSLGIVPFINAQILLHFLMQTNHKLQDLQKNDGEAGRRKILEYTRQASVGFAIFQALGHVLHLRPYVKDFTADWVLSSVTLLLLGSILTTFISERISDLKLGNGTALLICANIISYLPAFFGRAVAEAYNDGNLMSLGAMIFSFFLSVLSIVYVQEAERRIPLNYASRYFVSEELQKFAYLPFKV